MEPAAGALEEEAVPCLLSGVQADPLVGGIATGETKERVRIPPLREAGQQARAAEAVPKLLGTVPAEEPVLRVLSGQVEENLALPGAGAPGPSPATGEADRTACADRTAESWLRGTLLAVGGTHFSIDEKTMSVPPHGEECPPSRFA